MKYDDFGCDINRGAVAGGGGAMGPIIRITGIYMSKNLANSSTI